MFICKCRDDNYAHAYLYPYPQSSFVAMSMEKCDRYRVRVREVQSKSARWKSSYASKEKKRLFYE